MSKAEPPRFVAESYNEAITGYSYWRVVEAKTRKVAGEIVSGCAFPLDGILTQGAARRYADKLNAEYGVKKTPG